MKVKKENPQGMTNLVGRAIQSVEGFASLHHRFIRTLSIMGRSDDTVANYGRQLAAISLHYGRIPIGLSTEEVHEYLYSVRNRTKSLSKTCFKHTFYALRFLEHSEELSDDFFKLLPVKFGNPLPVVLSKEEVWRLLRAPKFFKHRILLGMLYGCGLRCSEVRNVRLRDLDFDRKVLHVVQGKGKKSRYVPLSEHLIRGLNTYIELDQPEDWLFNGMSTRHSGVITYRPYSKRAIQYAVKQAVQLAGILKDAHVHTLRHSYATHLLEDGLDVITLKNLLGHSRIQTTMDYLHVARLNPNRAFSPLDTLFAQCAPSRK